MSTSNVILTGFDSTNKQVTTALTTGPSNSGLALTVQSDGSIGLSSTSISGSWQNYTPVWDNNGAGTPSIGNGSLTGRYLSLPGILFYVIKLTGGSTTTYGTANTGNWRLSLPQGFTYGTSGGNPIGTALINQNVSPFALYPGACSVNAGTTGPDSGSDGYITEVAFGTSVLNQGNPVTWGNANYSLLLTGFVEHS